LRKKRLLFFSPPGLSYPRGGRHKGGVFSGGHPNIPPGVVGEAPPFAAQIITPGFIPRPLEALSPF